jgi:mRNA-degrading endonuclease toxin of MazEF toxin-antitoxin module
MSAVEKDFDRWNELKKNLNSGASIGHVHEREVWWCSIGLNIGSEQDGKNELFERPVLILRKFSRETVLAVPLSSKIKEGNYFLGFTHEGTSFTALLLSIKEISTKRLQRKMYTMDSIFFERIRLAVKNLILQEDEEVETPV